MALRRQPCEGKNRQPPNCASTKIWKDGENASGDHLKARSIKKQEENTKRPRNRRKAPISALYQATLLISFTYKIFSNHEPPITAVTRSPFTALQQINTYLQIVPATEYGSTVFRGSSFSRSHRKPLGERGVRYEYKNKEIQLTTPQQHHLNIPPAAAPNCRT